jgi:MPBQ/MSBQ methyltransferase
MNTSSLTQNIATAGRTYYDGPELLDGLLASITAAGLDPAHLEIDDLAPLDEFHALGRPATLALARVAGVTAGARVLDVGAGIGGPARFLASRYGARVTALDATPRFCRVAEELTRRTGLADRVEVVHGDALELAFGDGVFDLAWTQAVSQNVADKRRFIDEMRRVVVPGGRVAMFEIVTGPGGELEFPVPWADSPEQSRLVTAAELRATIEDAGLAIREWREGEDVLKAIGDAAVSEPPAPPSHTLDLGLLMPDYETRMAAMSRNVADRRVTLVQVVAERPS